MNRSVYDLPFSRLICILLACVLVNQTANGDEPTAKTIDQAKPKLDWRPLKGKWEVSQFGGDGPVEIKDNMIKLGLGDPLTGIRWSGKVLRENFELELEARRTDGFDFFCGLTFPVGKDQVTLVLGGWGGGVVGISNVDGHDASENGTTFFRNFDNDKWYKIRVRVDPHSIRAWIDGKHEVDQDRKGHEFDIRYEMDLSVPLGVAAFQCDSEIRNFRFRKLTASELKQADQRAAKAAAELQELESKEGSVKQKTSEQTGETGK